MKLSLFTVNVLKNFSSISDNLKILPGNSITSFSRVFSVYGEATVKDSFPLEVRIYDLPQFMSVLSLFESPDLNFQKDHVIISGIEGTIRFNYCADSPEILTSYIKGLPPATSEFEFDLSHELMRKIFEASSILSISDMSIVAESTGIYIKLLDTENPLKNNYSYRISDNTGNKSFNIIVDISKLKFLGGDYLVKICKNNKVGRVEFRNKQFDVNYYAAMKSESSWS